MKTALVLGGGGFIGGHLAKRLKEDGFWVRGVKVAQDDKEAEIVYNAFKQWMMWSELNRR